MKWAKDVGRNRIGNRKCLWFWLNDLCMLFVRRKIIHSYVKLSGKFSISVTCFTSSTDEMNSIITSKSMRRVFFSPVQQCVSDTLQLFINTAFIVFKIITGVFVAWLFSIQWFAQQKKQPITLLLTQNSPEKKCI